MTGHASPVGPGRAAGAAICFLVAGFLVIQFLGLLFIERIADRAAQADDHLRVPLSVRILAIASEKAHVNLDPDGASWPGGFRMFFFLELCGFAGIALALVQLGMALICRRTDWTAQAGVILVASCLALLIGFLSLKLV